MALGRLLFRQEAIDFQEQQRHWGDVALLQPVSIRVLAWGVTAIMVFSVTFLSLAEFARKQTVVGYLTPAAGTSKVFATRAGTTTAVYVIEGQEVQNGQPLLTIATPEITASGEDVKATKLEGLGREKDLLEEQIQIQSERVKLAQGLVDAAKYLLARGEISGVECKRREDTLLEHQQTLTSLRRQVAEKTQQIADIKGSSAYTLRAPAAGRISLLRAGLGQTVEPQHLQLEIVPIGSALQAELFIPTRAAGFVEAGQQVRFLYDAFPYQNFGAYTGRIAKISRTVVTGSEIKGPVELKEPVYRAIAMLDRQDVDAYGKKEPLQTGMLLKADIILDKRSLASWLLNPLLSRRM